MVWYFCFAQCSGRSFPFALVYRWMKNEFFRKWVRPDHSKQAYVKLYSVSFLLSLLLLLFCLGSVLSVYPALPVKCVFACVCACMWLCDVWLYAWVALTAKCQNSCWQCLGLRYLQTLNSGCHNFICTQWLIMRLNLAPAWSFILLFFLPMRADCGTQLCQAGIVMSRGGIVLSSSVLLVVGGHVWISIHLFPDSRRDCIIKIILTTLGC